MQIDAEGKVPRKVSVTNMISKKSDYNGSNTDSPSLEIDEEEYHPISKVPTLSVHKCGLGSFSLPLHTCAAVNGGMRGVAKKKTVKHTRGFSLGG